MSGRKKEKSYVRLATRDGILLPRTYAQSASGHISSTATTPLDSRSISIARASEQERAPYTTLRRYPTVVPHRSANDSRSGPDNGLRKVFKSMSSYHHTVTVNATPFAVFTKRLPPGDTIGMNVIDIKAIRRSNLAGALKLYLENNQSEMARLYNPKNPKPQQINDLLKNKDRAFGEKVARKLEAAIGLQRGQLDIENSPLLLQPGKSRPLVLKFPDLIKDLSPGQQSIVAEFITELKKLPSRTG